MENAINLIDSDTMVMLSAISVVMFRTINLLKLIAFSIKEKSTVSEFLLFVVACCTTYWYCMSIEDLSIQTLVLVFLALTEAPRGVYNLTKKNEKNYKELD